MAKILLGSIHRQPNLLWLAVLVTRFTHIWRIGTLSVLLWGRHTSRITRVSVLRKDERLV